MLDVLTKLEFDEREAIVYTALLERGPSSLRVLAEHTRLNRGTVYNALRRLSERGLVSFYHQAKRKHFIAEPPAAVLREAELKEARLSSALSALRDALPEMQSMYNDASEKPRVRYYEGINGVRNILDDLLAVVKKEKDRHYLVYSAADVREFLYECHPTFTEQRIKAKITVDVISIGPGGRLCGLDRRRWVSGTAPVGSTYSIVYADRTAHITKHKDTVVGVLVESGNIAGTQRLLFRALWDKLSDHQ